MCLWQQSAAATMTRGKQDSDAMVLEGVGGEFTS